MGPVLSWKRRWLGFEIPAMTADGEDLNALRREVDRVDDAIHDLLMQRTELIQRIGASAPDAADKGAGAAALAPGREATVIRRLLARHGGDFPREVLVRLWREVISALTRLRGTFTVAVFMPERGGAPYLEIARDQYGSYTETLTYQTTGRVLKALAEGKASVAVLPLPGEGGAEPWWPALIGDASPRVQVVARLPFGGPGRGRGDGAEALAVAAVAPEPTGMDRTLLAVETLSEISRNQAAAKLTNAGLPPVAYWDMRPFAPDARVHLVEIEGFVLDSDPRIVRLAHGNDETVRDARCIGTYPVPCHP